MNAKVSRNYKIEIIRIIACIAVIWYHIRELPFKSNGELSETAIFFECLCTICVMSFFFITGFFIYNKNGNIILEWFSLIKKFIIKTFIPFLIIASITIVFQEFFISRLTFKECLNNFSINEIVLSILTSIRNYNINNLPGTAAHLWYIYSYSAIIIAFPITKYILRYRNKYVPYAVLLVLTICMIVNDYHLFFNDSRYDIVFKIIHKPIYYSAIAYFLYNNIMVKKIDDVLNGSKEENKVLIINKPLFIFSSLLYIITFILLFFTEVSYDLGTNNGYVYTSWLSLYAVVLTSAFILCVYNLNIDRFLNDKIKNIISFISSKTFGIYLIHYLIITKLISRDVPGQLFPNRRTIFHHFAFYIIYGFFIFIISLLIVSLYEFLFDKIKLLISGGENGKEKRLS